MAFANTELEFSLKGSLLEYNVVSAGDLARDGQRIDEVVDNDDDGVRSVGEHWTVELTEHDDTTWLFNLSDNEHYFGSLACFESATSSAVEGRRGLMRFLGRLSWSWILAYTLLSDESSTSESSDSDQESEWWSNLAFLQLLADFLKVKKKCTYIV